MTNVAHQSLMTGRFAESLPPSGRLTPGMPIGTLAQALANAGWTTRAVTEDGLVGYAYGFARGFDSVIEHASTGPPADRAHLVFRDARAIVSAPGPRPLFLFLHTYKAHTPYDPSPSYRDRFSATSVGDDVPSKYRAALDAYDESIRELDDVVGGLLKALDEAGTAGSTLVALLADHGEAFGEHGLTGHGFSPYQEALHVPLVLRGPGVPAGLRVDGAVSLVDVAPTILDLLGLPTLPGADGISLRPALAGKPLPTRPLFFGWGKDQHGVRLRMWKFWVPPNGVAQAFELHRDPRERADSRGAAQFGKILRPQLEPILERHLRDAATRRDALVAAGMPESGVDAETQRALRALGYVQ